jgi:hypothetical protein
MAEAIANIQDGLTTRAQMHVDLVWRNDVQTLSGGDWEESSEIGLKSVNQRSELRNRKAFPGAYERVMRNLYFNKSRDAGEWE